jgi:hypothetical protein
MASTCNPGGAGRWRPEYTEALKRAPRVVVLADHDGIGEKHAADVARSFHDAGVTDVRIVNFPELPESSDVSDWLATLQGSEDEKASALRCRVGDTPRWEADRVSTAIPVATLRERRGGRCWDSGRDVIDFVSAHEDEAEFLVERLVARGAVTWWGSPRGIGKTLIAHAVAIDLARKGQRVMLIDRDNPRRDLKRRMRSWGLEGIEPGRLRLFTRDEAPPLTDTAKWRSFPVGEYDLVVVDSFDSAAEGVGEQDSSRPSIAIAALLDVVRAADGPAALLLGNTIKSGSHSRGSGVIEDRLDIVYEIRDLTGWTCSGKREWWLELPPAGRDSWGERAARRKQRVVYRLGFIPTKFRIGEEPEPFIYEVNLALSPWALTEATGEVIEEGERARTAAAEERQRGLEQLNAELAREVRARATNGPITERDGAVPFLMARGLTRESARVLIAQGAGKDWSIVGEARRGSPRQLIPPDQEALIPSPAGNGAAYDPAQLRPGGDVMLAKRDDSGQPETARGEAATDAEKNVARIRPQYVRDSESSNA